MKQKSTLIPPLIKRDFSLLRRNLRHIVVSDLNNQGIAHASQTPLPPATASNRSAGRSAIRNAGGVALATAVTQAPAVRQHGGGRTYRVLLTQQPSGRPTRSTGGEIKSLCCAAAGIIALAFRPCGAHSYPLTGVRRAAHTAAPLRSTPRPHAQPVKGYKAAQDLGSIRASSSLSTTQIFPKQNRIGEANRSAMGIQVSLVIFRNGSNGPAIDINRHLRAMSQDLENLSGNSDRQPLLKHRLQHVGCSIETTCIHFRNVQLLDMQHLRFETLHSKLTFVDGLARKFSYAKFLKGFSFFDFLLLFPMPLMGYSNSYENRADGTDSLHPARAFFVEHSKVDKHSDQRPKRRDAQHQKPQPPHRVLAHRAAYQSPFAHNSPLSRIESARLKARCHQVQRGVA